MRSSSLPVALLQLSCCNVDSGSASPRIQTLVLRLSAMERPPPALLSILGDEAVVKCGVGVSDDLRRIEAWARSSAATAALPAAGAVELLPLVKSAG